MTDARATTAAEQYRDFVHAVRYGSRVKVETPNAIGDVDVSVFQADTLATHIAAQDAKIAELVEALGGMVEHVQGEEFCYCEHKDNTEPADAGNAVDAARQALASIGETDD